MLLSIVTTFISKWVAMNFDRNEKKLLKGSHDLWERNQKIVYHKIFMYIEGNYSCKIHFSLQCQFVWFKV